MAIGVGIWREEPDCSGCVYDVISDCELCSDCGIHSQHVAYPCEDQAALEHKIVGLKDNIAVQAAHIVEIEADLVLAKDACVRVSTRYEAAEAAVEKLHQKLLSHSQNEHPHKYEELVEVLAREEKLKERVLALEQLIPAMPCCPDGFMDEACTQLKEALVVVGAAIRWRKPVQSYAKRQLLDDDLTKAVDDAAPKKLTQIP